MLLMRSSTLRSGKYSKKITGTVLPGQGRGYLASLPDRTRLEAVVKSFCTSPVLLFSYISYAEQLVKVGRTYQGDTAINEAVVITRKWRLRGLDQPTLLSIATGLGFPGVFPPCPPANFGEENAHNSWPFQVADRIRGLAFNCPSAGTVQSLTVDVRNVLAAVDHFKLAVYTDVAGSPGVPVAYTNSIPITGGFSGWVTEPVVGSPAIAAGSYFLVFWSDSMTISIGRTLTPSTDGLHDIPFDGWPNPMPGWAPHVYTTYCIYCTYVPDIC